MANIIAQWDLSLSCDCPHCKAEGVELTDAPDFWHNWSGDTLEYDTPNTTDVSVMCPECGECFDVDFQH